jgi:5'-nucleotidase
MPLLFSLLAASAATPVLADPPGPIRVLVTNDDGVSAPGIDAIVNKLVANPMLTVIVVAPATNQSGSGDSTTNPPSTIVATAATTASAVPATAVAGFPGDSTLFALRQLLIANPPDLVVSGINSGQNIGDLIGLSGTVGAALWAARLGIPAIAVSQGFVPPLTPPTSYEEAAVYTANVVEKFRIVKGFQKKMRETDPLPRGLVLNINFPSCPSGATRGVRVVPPALQTTITSYSPAGVDTWLPATTTEGNAFAVDCNTTLEPLTDIEAMNFGFASVSLLSATGGATSWKPKQFNFLKKVHFAP